MNSLPTIPPFSSGRIVTTPGALALLQGVVSNDVAAVEVGEAQYNLVLNEGGGVIEDLVLLGAEPVAPHGAGAERHGHERQREQARKRASLPTPPSRVQRTHGGDDSVSATVPARRGAPPRP